MTTHYIPVSAGRLRLQRHRRRVLWRPITYRWAPAACGSNGIAAAFC